VSEEDKTNAGEGQPPPEDDAEELTVDDILAAASDDGQAADDTVAVLQATLEERTRDLQRVTAEFQNYRKRVERDKSRAGELATAAVLQSLLPVLDDLDRARDHGDLNGPFGSVAEQLSGALAKHGLESFGMKGDKFDPQIHEAVAHMQMPDVDGPTCIDVMRSGYRLGDKLLRPALVAVAEPSEDAVPAEPDTEPEIVGEAPADEAAAPEAEVPDEAADGDAEEGAPEGAAEADAADDEAEVSEAAVTAEDGEAEAEPESEEDTAAAEADAVDADEAEDEKKKKKKQ
jgi:molecular chaperone GrpE